jgi:hypothetical protein
MFVFNFLAQGKHRVRVLRIGYAPWESGDLVVGAGVLDVTLTLPHNRVTLPDDIVVEGSGACSNDPGSAAATALLMQEARTAFLLTEQTLSGPFRRFRTRTYLRTVDPSGRVLEEQASWSVLRNWPIRSAPVDTLARWGFVRPPSRFQRSIGLGPTYFGPDGPILFSDWFLGAHCFRLTRDDGRPGMIGLAFRPSEDRNEPGIEGALWIDEPTLALDRLEFTFVNLSDWVPPRSAGGSVAFAQMPGGGWVIRRWRMRAPIGGSEGTTRTLSGFQETGGSVVEVLDRRGAHVMWLEESPAAPAPAP